VRVGCGPAGRRGSRRIRVGRRAGPFAFCRRARRGSAGGGSACRPCVFFYQKARLCFLSAGAFVFERLKSLAIGVNSRSLHSIGRAPVGKVQGKSFLLVWWIGARSG